MTIALAIVCVALVGLLAYREKVAAGDRATAAQDRLESIELVDRVRADLLAERDRAAEERRELYQRIQAPEIAVHDAQLERRRGRPYVRREPVGADNDAAYAARRAERQAERNGDGE